MGGVGFMAGVIFYALAALAVAGALVVAFSRNIVHSAFALLATFAGVAGLYAWMAADLVAVLQLLVYVGGVLVLILFAVMLTAKIDEARLSNRSLGRGPGLVILALVFVAIVVIAASVFGGGEGLAPSQPTAAALGNALLGPFVLPFEIISVLLLAALLGGVTLARGGFRSGPRGGEGR